MEVLRLLSIARGVVLYSLQNHQDGRSPVGGLVFDSTGNLYGSAGNNGQGFGGTVFELSPSNGGWTFNLLYSLSGTMGPMDSLTFDSAGNLYWHHLCGRRKRNGFRL
jgi:hypothetical protein